MSLVVGPFFSPQNFQPDCLGETGRQAGRQRAVVVEREREREREREILA
uniref:Uncharacterized protein n=1 Tax=Arundo donax TaxID=35708 RepID=A0A0A8Y1I3_ARUDO